MTYLGSEYVLYWLTASILFPIFYGLVFIGIAASRMTKDEDGKFKVTGVSEGLYFTSDWKVQCGHNVVSYRVDQEAYERRLKRVSYIPATLSVVSFVGFLVSALSDKLGG